MSFSAISSGQLSTYKTQGNIETKNGAYRVSFSLEKEAGLAYVFSVFKNKVSISATGQVSYNFTLRNGEVFNFSLNVLGKPIYGKVECLNLAVNLSDNFIQIDAKYLLDMGGNEVENELALKVELL